MSMMRKITASENLRAEVVKDFYKVGKPYRNLVNRFGAEASLFPVLSDSPPRFFSSTGQAPYPIALYREFKEITETACQNSKNRLKGISAQDPFILKRCN